MPEKQFPHIIIFNPDQWRGDVLGYLDNPAAQTPHLDALVSESGVAFANAFCQNPVCTPSRCSFMTGWYPHVRGHRTMHYMLRPDEPMLLRTLKDHGYYVWWGGKNDVVPAQNGFEAYCSVKYPHADPAQRPVWRNLHSYDDWRGSAQDDTYYSFYYGKIEKPANFPPEENFVYDSDWHNVLGAVNLIRSYAKDPSITQGKPLCIYLPLSSPHPPYAVEDPWFSQIDRRALPPRQPVPVGWDGKPSLLRGIHARQNLSAWDEARWAELRATYYGMCARTDHQFGLVLQALRETGLFDDTAVFFFADHGDFTGDYGLVEKTQNTFEDCLTHVPFVIKPPANVPCQPGVRDALVELVDFPATVEDLLGLQPQHTHFGRSLLPLISGQAQQHRQAVFCEGGRIHGEEHAKEPIHPVFGQKWLYWPRLIGQHSEGPEHTKAVMCRTKDFKFVRRLYEQDELYDLRNDPGEVRNQIDNPIYADVRAEMLEKVLDFMIQTADVVPHEYDQR